MWCSICDSLGPLGQDDPRVRSLALLACLALVGCGGASGDAKRDDASTPGPLAKTPAYAEAKDVCRELGVDRVADAYKSSADRDAAARAYAKPFLKPYRDAIDRGCRAGFEPARPDDVTCGQLRTGREARRLARQLVDRVVAPEGQSGRETIGIIGESLYVTCRQARIPGVDDVDHYRPVKPVLREVQRDFDQEEIEGLSGSG